MTGLEKLNIFGNKITLSVVRNSSKNSSFNTNPLKQLHNDTISFTSKGKYEYIDENDTSLFEDCNLHPLKSFNDLSFDNIVLVHKTDYFPENGIIKTLKNSVRDSKGNAEARSTLHFSLNNPVKSHERGNWDNKKNVILAPLKSTVEYQESSIFLGGMLNDFVLSGNLELPEDSVIIEYNEEIPNGKLRISKDKTTGLKLIESSNKNLSYVSQNIIKKMGFVCFKDLVKKNNVSNEEIMNGWKKFCNENNFLSSLVQYLPHHRADSLFYALYYLSLVDRWEYDSLITNVNYKDELLKIIDEIKESTPEDKPLSYNVDKLRKIIEEAETPKEAFENAKKECKITSVLLHQGLSKESVVQEIRQQMKNINLDDKFIKDDELFEGFALEQFQLWAGVTKDILAEIDIPNILDEYVD